MSQEHYGVVAQAVAEDLRALRASLVETAGTIAHARTRHMYDLLAGLDEAIEDKVTERLQAVDPGTPVVGEVRGGDRSVRRYWLVNPLNATLHYVRGNPYYCFMMALIVDGAPVVSVMYDFASDQLYHAVRGHGAYCNGKRIGVSAELAPEAMVQAAIDLSDTRNVALQQALAERFPLLHLSAPGYELAMIASGRAEARVCIDSFNCEGEVASGALLVQEAGGVARNLSGADYRTSDKHLIIAASPELYEQLHSLVVTTREAVAA